MSTFGKVLLFLNLLAAGGLVYVSSQDWARRQEISGVVLRYQLTLQGVPVETPKSSEASDAALSVEVESASGMTLQTASAKLLKAHYTGFEGGDLYKAGSNDVVAKSLVAELDRVEKVILGQVESQNGDEAKLSYLVGGPDANGFFQPGVLLNMAESFEERIAIRSLNYPKPTTPELLKKNADDAKSRLIRKVDALKKPPAPKELDAITAQIDELKKAIEKDPKDEASKAKFAAFSAQGAPAFTRDESDRRRRITLFLALLDPSAAWQKRVALVAGLRTYTATLTEQAARLTDVARQTERAIEIDQATYESEYELMKKLAIKQDTLVSDEDANYKGRQEMEALDAASKAGRETQLAALKTQLADLQNKIAGVLAQQAAAEKAVFDLQRKVGDTLRGNLDLEATLDRAEQKK